MAINDHLHPYGTKLYYSTDGISYTEVDDLIDVDSPEPTFGKSNDTTLTTPDFLKVFSPGWLEQSDADFTVYMHKTQHAALGTHFYAKTHLYWKVVAPLLSGEATASQWVWRGYLIKFKAFDKLVESGEDKYRTMLTIAATTKVTFTAGA